MKYLERLVDDISSSESPSYGKHLTREEVSEIVRNQDSTDHLLGFLADHNIRNVLPQELVGHVSAVFHVAQFAQPFPRQRSRRVPKKKKQ